MLAGYDLAPHYSAMLAGYASSALHPHYSAVLAGYDLVWCIRSMSTWCAMLAGYDLVWCIRRWSTLQCYASGLWPGSTLQCYASRLSIQCYASTLQCCAGRLWPGVMYQEYQEYLVCYASRLWRGVMYQEYQEYLVCYAGRLLTWCDVSGDGPHYSAVLAGNDHWCEPSCLTATQCTSPCGNNESSLCGGMGAQAGVWSVLGGNKTHRELCWAHR